MPNSEHLIFIQFSGRKPYIGLPGHTAAVPETDFCAVRATEYNQIQGLLYPDGTTVNQRSINASAGHVGPVEQIPSQSYYIFVNHPQGFMDELSAILTSQQLLTPHSSSRGPNRESYEYPSANFNVLEHIPIWTSIEELVKMIDAKLGK